MYETQELGNQSVWMYVAAVSWKPTNLSGALQNSRPGPPNPLPADDVSGDVHLCVHKASLFQGYVIIQVRFDGGTLLGHDLGLDGSNFLHWHGFWQGSDQNKTFWWVETSGCRLLNTKQHIRSTKAFIPNLVSLHDALFVAFQTSGQTLLIQTHSFFILKMMAVWELLQILWLKFNVCIWNRNALSLTGQRKWNQQLQKAHLNPRFFGFGRHFISCSFDWWEKDSWITLVITTSRICWKMKWKKKQN